MCSVEKRGRVFILTLTGDDEHRLNPDRIAQLRAALARIRSESASTPGGAALVTAAEGKFFSNGFDLAWANAGASSPAAARERLGHMVSLFAPVVADLMSLPMPTIAAITGHAAAAGFMLALSHDYVKMRKDRGVLYMSELDIGLPFPPYFMALMRTKIGDTRALRDVTMRAVKMSAVQAVERGIVDEALGSAAETVEAAVKLGEELAARKWDGKVYASIRTAAFPELSRAVGLTNDEEETGKTIASRL